MSAIYHLLYWLSENQAKVDFFSLNAKPNLLIILCILLKLAILKISVLKIKYRFRFKWTKIYHPELCTSAFDNIYRNNAIFIKSKKKLS